METIKMSNNNFTYIIMSLITVLLIGQCGEQLSLGGDFPDDLHLHGPDVTHSLRSEYPRIPFSEDLEINFQNSGDSTDTLPLPGEELRVILDEEYVLVLKTYAQWGSVITGIGTLLTAEEPPDMRELFVVMVLDEGEHIASYHLWDGKIKEIASRKDIITFSRRLVDFVGEENRRDLGEALITLYKLIRDRDEAPEHFDEVSDDLKTLLGESIELLNEFNEHIIWYRWQTFVTSLLLFGGLLPQGS
jgi:hypothetical protein